MEKRRIVLAAMVLVFLAGCSQPVEKSLRSHESSPASPILTELQSPILFHGNETVAYRDPAVLYHDGAFYLFFTVCRFEEGTAYWYLGSSRSENLVNWDEVKLLTPRDLELNFSSPGNVVRFREEWVLCLQTYPTPNNETYGTADSRIWVIRSGDLMVWDQPELLRVKGPDVPQADMGRMIDPYLVLDPVGKWWCFYKQSGVSMSSSSDLLSWEFRGNHEAGENVCVLPWRNEYLLFHSPENGIGIKVSKDLLHWQDWAPLITLGQEGWRWAQGRLTAATVIDLRDEPQFGCYVMFFHGSTKEGLDFHPAHGRASLGIAWSHDLKSWDWPGR